MVTEVPAATFTTQSKVVPSTSPRFSIGGADIWPPGKIDKLYGAVPPDQLSAAGCPNYPYKYN